MHLPFIQIDTDMIEQVAPDVAIELDADEMAILGGLVRLVKWALGRVPEGALPSEHALITGPNAARLIARAAGHQRDPEAFVAACSRCAHAILEVVPEGIRIRGLDRYDAAVTGAEVRSKAAKAAAEARWNAERMRDASESQSKRTAKAMRQNAKTKTQTHTKTQKKTEEKPPPPAPSGVDGVEPEQLLAEVVVERVRDLDRTGTPCMRDEQVVRWTASPVGCWEMIQLHRELHGLPRERTRPKGFDAWAADALATAGPDAVERTVIGFLDDESIRAPEHPTAVFLACWDARAPATAEAGGTP